MKSRISVRAARFTSLAFRSLTGSVKSKMKRHCSIFLRRRLDFSDDDASGKDRDSLEEERGRKKRKINMEKGRER